jgi:hypothetical protein
MLIGALVAGIDASPQAAGGARLERYTTLIGSSHVSIQPIVMSVASIVGYEAPK